MDVRFNATKEKSQSSLRSSESPRRSTARKSRRASSAHRSGKFEPLARRSGKFEPLAHKSGKFEPMEGSFRARRQQAAEEERKRKEEERKKEEEEERKKEEEEEERQRMLEKHAIMSLACDFRLKYRDEPWSDRRQETFERLLNAVSERRVAEKGKIRKDREHKFETKQRVVLANVQKVLQEEEERRMRISKMFEGTYQDIARQHRIGELVQEGLRKGEVLRGMTEAHGYQGLSDNKSLEEEQADRLRRFAETKFQRQQRELALQRVREFQKTEKKRAKQANATRRRRHAINIPVPPAVNKGQAARKALRRRFLSTIQARRGQSDKASSAGASASAGTSADSTNDRSVSGAKPKIRRRGTLKRFGSRMSISQHEDAASKLYRTHRCLFNPAQLDAVERVYRQLVRDTDPSARARNKKGDAGSDAEEAESRDANRGGADDAGGASRTPMAQKGVFVSQRALSLSQLQRALRRSFGSEEDLPLVRRIYSVMCGRDPGSKREGLTFGKFSTFLSIMMLGSSTQRAFLCFEILDTDRDGALSQHDMFTLLRSDTDSALSEDFETLLRWVLDTNERRRRREKAWAKRKLRRQRLVKKALKRHFKERQGREDSSDSSSSSSEGSSSDESILSNDSASDWVVNDHASEAAAYQRIMAKNLDESRLTFERFRALWDKRKAPELANMINACFPMVPPSRRPGSPGCKDGDEADASVSADIASSNSLRPAESVREERNNNKKKHTHGSSRHPFESGLVLLKTKHNLLGALHDRMEERLRSALKWQAVGNADAAPEQKEVPRKLSPPEPKELAMALSRAPGAQEGSASERRNTFARERLWDEKNRPGKFLRKLGLSVAEAQRCRMIFDLMRREGKSDTDTVNVDGFFKVLSDARVGFEQRASLRLIAERLFAVAAKTHTKAIQFSEFLELNAIVLAGARRDKARLCFDAINISGGPYVVANDVEAVVNAGLEDLDPLLANALLDMIVEKVTRSEPANISVDDLIALAEHVRNEKAAHAAVRKHWREQAAARALLKEAESEQPSKQLSKQLSKQQAQQAQQAQSPQPQQPQQQPQPPQLQLQQPLPNTSMRPLSTAKSSKRGRTRRRSLRSVTEDGESNNSSDDAKLLDVGRKLHDFELPSVRKREAHYGEYPGVEFLLVFKLEAAFGPASPLLLGKGTARSKHGHSSSSKHSFSASSAARPRATTLVAPQEDAEEGPAEGREEESG